MLTANQLNVLVAEDHPITLKALKSLIVTRSRHPVFVDETDTVSELLDMLRKKTYDLLILNIHLKDCSILSELAYIKNLYPKLKIIIFSSHSENVYAYQLLKAGADGFVSKCSTEDEIWRAYSMVVNNKKYVSPELMYKLAFNTTTSTCSNPFESLTQREFEIVTLLLEGSTNSHIASTLNLQQSTVSTHKNKIFEKLRITNLMELAQLAKSNGFIA